MIGIVADKIVSVTEIPEIVRAIAQFYMRIVIQESRLATRTADKRYSLSIFSTASCHGMSGVNITGVEAAIDRAAQARRVGQFKTLKIGDRCFSITVFQAHQ